MVIPGSPNPKSTSTSTGKASIPKIVKLKALESIFYFKKKGHKVFSPYGLLKI
jgi:hypothetical protein